MSPIKDQFNGEPVHFSYVPDLTLEQARDVTIKLHSQGARFIKLQLYFAAHWIMLSEITFESGEHNDRELEQKALTSFCMNPLGERERNRRKKEEL